MQYFFHADTTKFDKVLKHSLIIVIMPVAALCTFCTVNVVINIRSPLTIIWIGVILGSVLLGMIFTFAAVYVAEKTKRRHARYTFFDFVPGGMVFSEYAGEFSHWGKHTLMRRLYYIPFGKLGAVSRDPKTAPHDITFTGEIREYFCESKRLGYHVGEDGTPVFDTEILNIGQYNIISSLTVKERFGNTKRLEKAVLYHLEQFRSIPEKKPFDISEYVTMRKKPRPRTSNPALDAPSFNRNWS